MDTRDYAAVRALAQKHANETGCDYGLEKIGGHYRIFMLPQRRFRFGHERGLRSSHVRDAGEVQAGPRPDGSLNMDPLLNLPGWHRDLSADDVAAWRAWADMTGIYASEWTEAYLEAQNISGPATRRQLRRMRQGRSPMRLRVNVLARYAGPEGEQRVIDSCEVYGWRAALVAVRALRTEHGLDDVRDRRRVYVLDSRLSDAVEDALYGEE
jgi:hypothetical protein